MGDDRDTSATQAAGKRTEQPLLGPGRRRLLWASVAFFACVALVVTLTALGVEHH